MMTNKNYYYSVFEYITSDETYSAFLDLCHKQAHHLAQDHDCIDCTILPPKGTYNVIAVFEVFKDKEAFESYKNSEIYKEFHRVVKEWEIKKKQINA